MLLLHGSHDTIDLTRAPALGSSERHAYSHRSRLLACSRPHRLRRHEQAARRAPMPARPPRTAARPRRRPPPPSLRTACTRSTASATSPPGRPTTARPAKCTPSPAALARFKAIEKGDDAAARRRHRGRLGLRQRGRRRRLLRVAQGARRGAQQRRLQALRPQEVRRGQPLLARSAHGASGVPPVSLQPRVWPRARGQGQGCGHRDPRDRPRREGGRRERLELPREGQDGRRPQERPRGPDVQGSAEGLARRARRPAQGLERARGRQEGDPAAPRGVPQGQGHRRRQRHRASSRSSPPS